MLPSTSRASVLASDSAAGTGVSWASSTAQLNASAPAAARTGATRGTTKTISVWTSTV
nr:hypothetical protein GCM10020093_034610 [Planobispora longispora]